jgi:hypothetical protein
MLELRPAELIAANYRPHHRKPAPDINDGMRGKQWREGVSIVAELGERKLLAGYWREGRSF